VCFLLSSTCLVINFWFLFLGGQATEQEQLHKECIINTTARFKKPTMVMPLPAVIPPFICHSVLIPPTTLIPKSWSTNPPGTNF